MKTLLTLFMSSFITIAVYGQAIIPNASFENWYPYANGEYPNSWTTSDSVAVALGGGTSVYSDSDAYDGSLAMHLKSVSAGFVNGPGLATNGLVNFSGGSFVFSGGTPDTTRSRNLTGYFKYTPMDPGGLDQGFIRVVLLRDSASQTDTIAEGFTYFTDTVPTYTPFTTMIEYNDYTRNPTKFLIIISSSMNINDPNLGVGTELVIDSLNFTGTVGINEVANSIKSVNIYPSPADKQLTVDVELIVQTDLNYTLFDLSGKKVLNASMSTAKETIDVSSLKAGNYILSLTDNADNVLYTKNVSISR
jgi:hypothetical protein